MYSNKNKKYVCESYITTSGQGQGGKGKGERWACSCFCRDLDVLKRHFRPNVKKIYLKWYVVSTL